MSAPADANTPDLHPISLEDIRHKALRIRDDVTDEARAQVSERRNQMILVGVVAVVAVVAALSLVYFVGTQAGRAAAKPPTR